MRDCSTVGYSTAFFVPSQMRVFWGSVETHMRRTSRLYLVLSSVDQAGQIIGTAVFPLRVSLLR